MYIASICFVVWIKIELDVDTLQLSSIFAEQRVSHDEPIIELDSAPWINNEFSGSFC